MIRFYFHPTPNPIKIALFLEEAGLPYETVPVDTSKGEQHMPAFRAINPNGKVPAIVDTEGAGGREVTVFDSTAILLYLAEKTGSFLGRPVDRPELLSWLMFLGSGLGPFSGQAVHFQFVAPEGEAYARNRYRREAERHYQVLNDRLAGREFIMGDDYTIADVSAWGWLTRASRVRKGEDDPLGPFPHLKRLFETIDGRPAAARAPARSARITRSRRPAMRKRGARCFRRTIRPPREGHGLATGFDAPARTLKPQIHDNQAVTP